MPAASPALAVALRVALAVPGGYALTVGVVALATALLAAATPMPRAEAYALSAMLGFVFYLVVLLWAFAERSLARLAAVVLGGAGTTYGLALAVGGG